MCIAILKPKGKEIPKEILEECCKNNPDGMGFAYNTFNSVKIKKFMKFDDFYKEYKKHEKQSTMLIHFRIATHGRVEVNNCHPFKLNSRMALIHNGVISGYGDKKNKVDTQDFIDKVIGNISYKMWNNPSYRELVGKAIGYSKFCILDKSGKYYIINEDYGSWDDGIWYSNKSYQPKAKPKVGQRKLQLVEPYWDMYGEESYDDWYQRFQSSKYGTAEVVDTKDDTTYCRPIYKCNKCGDEFLENIDKDIADIKCHKCDSEEFDEIGMSYGREKYYYNELCK